MWIRNTQKWSSKQLLKRLSTVQSQVKDHWKTSPLFPVKQNDEIGPVDRDKTVRWLLQVTICFQFYPETFFLSVNLLDRFITSVKANTRYLKCIAITCLYLACKVVEEEEITPSTRELIKASGCGCGTGDILRMEQIILEKLSWNLCTTTSLQYLHVYHALVSIATEDSELDCEKAQQNLQKLTHTLVRVISYYPIIKSFSSAVIALAVFSFGLEQACNKEWVNYTLEMQSLAKLSTNDVMRCRWMVRRHVLSTSSSDSYQNNPAFLLNIPSAEQNLLLKQITSGKRKASSEMRWEASGDTKRPSFDQYEYDADVESDATLTASETGDEIEDENVYRMPTYAEVVKFQGPWINLKSSPRLPPLIHNESLSESL